MTLLLCAGALMKIRWWSASFVLGILSLAVPAGAVSSAELYRTQAHQFGRFEARLRFAAGDGVVSSFFLWKEGSDISGTFWNELDFEKVGADCRLRTNPFYGLPAADHSRTETVGIDPCADYHTYSIEWTPTAILWSVDGMELRREEGDAATAFAENTAAGMQVHFNIWPGDATFGGNFDPAILPVHQYISWVAYSSYDNGTFTPEWREEFTAGTIPSGWATGNWGSPKNLSTHAPANDTFVDGIAVLSLTADDARGFIGTPPPDGSGTAGAASDGESSSSDDAGCGCRVTAKGRADQAAHLLALAVAALIVLRQGSRKKCEHE
jgi:endo-1,3-1,4-beta-glycanase ExoK